MWDLILRGRAKITSLNQEGVREENSPEKSAKGEGTDLENTAEIDKQVMTHLDERTRRIYAAGLAKKYGYGGVSKGHRELGLDYKTIRRGLRQGSKRGNLA